MRIQEDQLEPAAIPGPRETGIAAWNAAGRALDAGFLFLVSVCLAGTSWTVRVLERLYWWGKDGYTVPRWLK